MTATLDRAPLEVPSPTQQRVGRWTSRVWALPLLAGLLALAVRAVGLLRSTDLFIDELLYTHFADQVAHGSWPGENGVPFTLHPIGSFALDGLVIRALGLSGTTMDLVFDLRWVNAVLGALTVALAAVVVRRLVGPRTAVLAAVVLAFDPFVLRNNGRVMIETPAVVWLLAGWLAVLVVLSQPDRRLARRAELLAGLMLGMALVTKDMTVIPGVAAVVLAVLWRRTLPARSALRMVAAATVPYLVQMAVIVSLGILGPWGEQKLSGIRRMVGLDQDTGFNATGGESLVSRLADELLRFGTSYALLAICVPAGLVALFSAVPARRFIGLVAVLTGALGVYAVGFGAAEEQFGYYVMVAAVLAVAAAGADLVERRRSLRRPVAVLAVLFTLASVALGVQSRLVSDGSYLDLRAWLQANVAADERVGLTGDAAVLAFPQYDNSPSLLELRDNGDDYAVTTSKPLLEGYGYAAPELLGWLTAHATPVFSVEGPSNGDTVVWRLDPAVVDAAVDAGTTIPAVRTVAP